jgi:hypothetical protein
MKILTLIETINGNVGTVESFPVFEEQLSEDVIEQAEQRMIELIKKEVYFESTEEQEQAIEKAVEEHEYDDLNGYFISLVYSY